MMLNKTKHHGFLHIMDFYQFLVTLCDVHKASSCSCSSSYKHSYTSTTLTPLSLYISPLAEQQSISAINIWEKTNKQSNKHFSGIVSVVQMWTIKLWVTGTEATPPLFWLTGTVATLCVCVCLCGANDFLFTSYTVQQAAGKIPEV